MLYFCKTIGKLRKMPFFRNSVLSTTTRLGLWEIEESPETLLSGLRLSPTEFHYYETLHNVRRKQQWLSYRKILARLMNEEGIELVYDTNGKPHPAGKDYHISVAHSGRFSAAIVSAERPVGIDIEMLRERIERVKERFLSDEELDRIGSTNRLEKLYICWGIKEALYKLFGDPSVGFEKDIRIHPFEYTADQGVCSALVQVHGKTFEFHPRYEKIEEYMLVYTDGISS
jgi:4'-phosphopantetheinyl transferase